LLSGPICTLPALLLALNAAPPTPASGSPKRVEPEHIPIELRSATDLTLVSRRLDGPPRGKPITHPLERLCTTPCTAHLPAGQHELAVVRREGPPLPVTPAFRLDGVSRLEIETISHATGRRTGFWLMALGIPLGAVSTTIGFSLPDCGDDLDCQRWTSLPIWGGIGIASLSVILGVPLLTRDDEAVLRIAPTGRSVSLVGNY
jgi:hypothetical protein